jgi:dTMP kinase
MKEPSDDTQVEGLLITFEGGEGSGKSTQARLLHEHLTALGREVIISREPGGTVLGEKIRQVLLHPESKGMDPLSELFLYLAARKEHVEKVIRPGLMRGAAVVVDRFSDATVAYQGYGRGLDVDFIQKLNGEVTGGLVPDITFLLVMASVQDGLNRAGRRHRLLKTTGDEDRFEKEALSFHELVRRGYLDLARRFPQRIVTLDGEGTVEDIHRKVLDALTERFTGRQ